MAGENGVGGSNFKGLEHKMENIEDKMNKLLTLMESESEKAELRYQLLSNKLSSVEERTNQVEGRINDVAEEVAATAYVVGNLQVEVNRLKQDKLCDNIIIRGVLEKENNADDLKCLLDVMFSWLSDDVSTEDTLYYSRTGAKDSKFPRPILVRFKTNEIKQKILKLKKQKSLNCAMLNSTPLLNSVNWGAENDLIYFNDHMTAANKKLNDDARKLRGDKKVQFVWTMNGTTFVKKEKGVPATRILSDLDIQKISGEPRRSQRRKLISPEKTVPEPKKDKNEDSVASL